MDIIKLLQRDAYSVADLSKKLKKTQRQVKEELKTLKLQGVILSRAGGKWYVPKVLESDHGDEYTYTSRPDNTYVFGFLGDSHLCSKYERLDVLNDLYNLFELEGVDRVFHTGNWIDGECDLNRHDLKVHGIDDQCDYLVKNYPKKEGIDTYAIAGDDHEGWWAKKQGIDIGNHCENLMRQQGRKDWFNLGYMESFTKLKNINTGKHVRLLTLHPGGGSAYAISYRPQKIVEAFSGGEKPAIVLIGHYHKLSYNIIRNVHAIQTGCFCGTTLIETSAGKKPIREIEIGDLVLTHRNRFRRVIDTMVRNHTNGFYKLNYARRGRPDQTITATPEHPFLIERDGTIDWMPIEEIVPGDLVFIQTSSCKVCKEPIPYYTYMCPKCNPMDVEENRLKISKIKGGPNYTRKKKNKHFEQIILPRTKKLKEEGWQIVPIGYVIPDAIGFKDGKICVFEFEDSIGNLRKHKESKYENDPIQEFIDEAIWINTKTPSKEREYIHTYDAESGFIKVPVLSNEYESQGTRQRTTEKVYNLEVEEDNSYLAGNVVVHNCQQDQSIFMRKKGLDAHIGGGICRLRQDPRTGAIYGCQVEFFQYFVKGYYNGRWGYRGLINSPERTT